MTIKTIILQRNVNGRVHQSTLRRRVHMHIDIIAELIQRCINHHVNVDVDALIDNVTDKY